MLKATTDNRKMKDHLILNVTSYESCPSKALGLCPFYKDCYARAMEERPTVKRDRLNREKLWNIDSVEEIIWSLMIDYKAKASKGNPPKALRFNESGDFKNQEDIDKMKLIIQGFKERVLHDYGENIKCYGYTKRVDLDLRGLSRVATINLGIPQRHLPQGLGGKKHNTLEDANYFLAIPLEEFKNLPETSLKCKCCLTTDLSQTCSNCDLCKEIQASPIYTILERPQDSKAIKQFKKDQEALNG